MKVSQLLAAQGLNGCVPNPAGMRYVWIVRVASQFDGWVPGTPVTGQPSLMYTKGQHGSLVRRAVLAMRCMTNEMLEKLT